MNFAGIYLWDSKYGKPKESESISDFLYDLEKAPHEPNSKISQFAKFMAEFAQQACELYSDELIEEYIDWSLDGNTSRVILISEIPYRSSGDLIDYFYNAIYKGAKDNGLMLYNVEIEKIILPDKKKYDKRHAEWLHTLEAPIEVFLYSPNQVSKMAAKMLKAHTKKMGIKKTKITTDAFIIKLKGIKLSLSIHFDNEYVNGEEIIHPLDTVLDIETNFDDFISISFNDFHKLHVSPIGTIEELQEFIDKCIELIDFAYPHCKDFNNFYEFLKENENNHCLTGLEPYTLRNLARMTQQPDYDNLRKQYLQKHIEVHNKKHDEYDKYYSDEGKKSPYEKLTEEELKKEFEYSEECFRFATESVNTIQEVIEFLELTRLYTEEGVIPSFDGCVGVLKATDIGEGPYFIVVDFCSLQGESLYGRFESMPKGAKPILLCRFAEYPKEKAFIKKHGGFAVCNGTVHL